MKSFFLTALLAVGASSVWAQDPTASFGATVYAEQNMTENASGKGYMVNWVKSTTGETLTADKANINQYITTVNIDASAISGSVSSISVFANNKEAIAGPLFYNAASNNTFMTSGAPSNTYAKNAQSDVVTIKGESKTCVAYLLPIDLENGVKVTIKTSDGKFYTQNFSDKISAGTTVLLTVTQTTANNLWMSTIPGNIYFSYLSTPGAHDAATCSVSGGLVGTSNFAKCQGEDLATLLSNGVRAFDLRPNYMNNNTITADNLYIYHGSYNTNVKYVDAMATLVNFVKDNPTEAVTVVMVKEKGDGKNDKSDDMWSVMNTCHSGYSDYMKVVDHSYYTLDDFRGKICYFNRTGTDCTNTTRIVGWTDNGTVSDYSATVGGTCVANIQDEYKEKDSEKQACVHSMLQLSCANTLKKRFHFNFSSIAYRAGWTTLLTSPGEFANVTNPVITGYLTNGEFTGPTGYLFADFIGSSSNNGAAYLTAIINQNYRYVYKGASRNETVADNTGNHASLSEAKGWKKVSNLWDLRNDDYYYAIVDKATGLMMSYEEGCNQSVGNVAYKTMMYRDPEQAEMNPSMLWVIEKLSESSDLLKIRSAVPGTDKYLQTEYNASQFFRSHDNGGNNASWYSWIFDYNQNSKDWVIMNSKYPIDGGVGPWSDGSFTVGMEVAANKSDYANMSHFEIYAIAKNRVDWVNQARRKNRANYTHKIVNHSMEISESAATGWTNDGTSFAVVTNANMSNRIGSRFAEIWATATDNFNLTQTISGLPNGYYELSALCINAAANHNVYLYAGDDQIAVTKTGSPADLYTVRTYVTNGTLTIGFKGSKPQNSWVAVDDFCLYYLGNLLSADRGWSRVTDLSTLADPNRYYLFMDKATGLMLNFEEGANQSSELAYKTLVYREEENAVMNPAMLWTMESNDSNTNGFSFMSAVPGTIYYLQTEGSNSAWYCRTHDNGGGDASWCSWIFAYDATNKWWTIQNGKYPNSGFIGPWVEANFNDGAEVAANKSGDANVGHFEIFSIEKSRAQWKAIARQNNPMNCTYHIVNPNFEKGCDGWSQEQNTFDKKTEAAFANKSGYAWVEIWAKSGDYKLSQTLTNLPNGIYTLSALCIRNEGNTMYLNAGEEKTEVSYSGNTAPRVTVQTRVTNGTLTIGISGTKNANSWIAVDDFRLEYQAALVTLADAAGYTETEDVYAAEVKYAREMGSQWGTIVLPFDVTIDKENQSYDFYRLSSVDNGVINLSLITDAVLPAGTPAVLRRDAAVTGISIHAEDLLLKPGINNLDASYALHGTYEVLDITDQNGYIISKNTFWNINDIKGSNNVYLAPFRSFLYAKEAQTSSSLRIGMTEEEAEEETDALEALEKIFDGEAEYYDMNGRRMEDMQTGVNIVRYNNGSECKTVKVIIR